MDESAEWRKWRRECELTLKDANRRAQQYGAPGVLTMADLKSILDDAQNGCECCGHDTSSFEVDHIIPFADGGTNFPENIQLLCYACHKTKTAIENHYRKRGKAVPHLARHLSTTTVIRFDQSLMRKVDAMAQACKMSRNAWIETLVSQVLEPGLFQEPLCPACLASSEQSKEGID